MAGMTTEQRGPEKVWVVGLDGATFDLLRPWMDEGRLPNLARLAAEGVFGPLRSTVPPVTAPAWASFMTGVNPGKHGVFDFTVRGTRGVTWASSQAVRAPKLWRVLTKYGKSVGVVNVPVTYPAEPVNGFVIPGFLTPRGATPFTYPAGLFPEILDAVGDYVINVRIAGRERGDEASARALVAEIQDAVAKREAAVHYLLDNHPTDFLMIVFMSLDKVQHVFWKYLDSASSLYHTAEGMRYRELLLPCYEQIDAVVGRMMARLDDRTLLFVMSDHGFGALDMYVDLNRWLADEGLLRIHKGKALWRELRRRLNVQGSASGQLHGGVAADPTKMDCIDWSRTRAYCGEISGQGVFINVRGREPHGIVEPGPEYERLRDRIAEGLLALREPGSDRPIVDHVHRREELYHGPHVDKAPDLLVVMREYSYLLLNSVRFTRSGYLRPIADARGFHRQDGIVMAWGQGIASGRELRGAEIIDLAPTILCLMDVPIPEHMDGKVLDVLEEQREHPVVIEQAKDDASVDQEDVYSVEEAEEIRRRLEDLGYLG